MSVEQGVFALAGAVCVVGSVIAVAHRDPRVAGAALLLMLLSLGALYATLSSAVADLLGQLQGPQRVDEDGRDFRARVGVADGAAHLEQAARLLFAPVLGLGRSVGRAAGPGGCSQARVVGRRRRCRK